MDVDECGDCLDLGALLRMVDEVALAGLIFGVPFEDVELRVTRLGPLTLVWGKIGGGGALESLMYFAVRASGKVHEAKA